LHPQKNSVCTNRKVPFQILSASFRKNCGRRYHFKRTNLPLNKIDGVVVGEGFANAPNSARVIANLIGLPNEIPCLTVANNCVSGMESVVESARRILLGEGELFLAIGEESQTSMPFIVKNARINKKTASLDKLKKALAESTLPEGVEVRDTLEDGLGDGETSYGMQITAEIVSQNYGLSRAVNDKVAFQSFKRALEATEAGLYEPYLIPIADDEGNIMKADEAVLLRKGLVENPDRMGRAMLMFDNPQMKFTEFQAKYAKDLKKTHAPTVSIFNASPRSDGAAGVIVTTVEKAKELGLEISAVLTGWKMKGVHPNEMGLGQAAATLGLLQDMNMKIQDVDTVEIHEAFAATAVGALEEIKNQTGWDWEKSFDEKKINTYGGSISIGHPFGATGIRLIANAVMDMKNDPSVNKILLTACAHGGIAGALMVERYKG
jgi:acetyl-CoA C-acetyltransferase